MDEIANQKVLKYLNQIPRNSIDCLTPIKLIKFVKFNEIIIMNNHIQLYNFLRNQYNLFQVLCNGFILLKLNINKVLVNDLFEKTVILKKHLMNIDPERDSFF